MYILYIFSTEILISWGICNISAYSNYVTTIVGTNKMKLISSSDLSWSRETWGNSETIPVARFPCPLYRDTEAYQPTTLGNWQQCHILIIYAMNSPIFFSSPIFFFLFLHCCSSYVHSCLTVIFTSVMLVLVTLFRPLDTALNSSSMNPDAGVVYQIFISGYFLLSSTSCPPPIPFAHIPIPLPGCQTRSWARFW